MEIKTKEQRGKQDLLMKRILSKELVKDGQCKIGIKETVCFLVKMVGMEEPFLVVSILLKQIYSMVWFGILEKAMSEEKSEYKETRIYI